MKYQSQPQGNRVSVSPKFIRLALGAIFVFISLAAQRQVNATEYVVQFRLADSLKRGNKLFIHLFDANGKYTATNNAIPTSPNAIHTITLKGDLEGTPTRVRVHSGDHRDTWAVSDFSVKWWDEREKRNRELRTLDQAKVTHVERNGYGWQWLELGEPKDMKGQSYIVEFNVLDGVDKRDNELFFYLYSDREGDKVIGRGIQQKLLQRDSRTQISTRNKHRFEVYGHLDGPLAGIRVHSGDHRDTWSVGNFEVTWKEPGNASDTTIASSQYVTHKPADGYGPHFVDFPQLLRYSEPLVAKQYVIRTFFSDARFSEGGDEITHEQSRLVGEEVGVSNQTAKQWGIGTSVAVEAEAGLPGIGKSKVTAEFSANYGEEYTRASESVTKAEFASGFSTTTKTEPNAEKFSQYTIQIPYQISDIIGTGKTQSMRKLSGSPSVAYETHIAIGPNHDPVPEAEVKKMIEAFKGWEPTKAEQLEKRLDIWLAKGWVYK